MCYYGNPEYTKRKRKDKYRFSEPDIKALAKIFFPKTLALNIGAAAEATVHKNFVDIILLAKQYKVPSVSLTTNGQKLTSAEISSIVSSGLNEIILSVHGVSPETYEHFMGNAKFSKLLEVLDKVKLEKDRAGTNLPEIRLNYTANPSNFRELKDLVARFKSYDITTLQVRPVVDIPDAPYEWEDFSPYRKEYDEILRSVFRDCHKNGIRLLATFSDPTLKKRKRKHNPRASILDMVLRPIKPGVVWKKNFDWQNETYREYCRRISYRSELLKYALFPARWIHHKDIEKEDIYLTYDVMS